MNIQKIDKYNDQFISKNFNSFEQLLIKKTLRPEKTYDLMN